MAIVFSGTGRCIPDLVIDEKEFMDYRFFDQNKNPIADENEKILKKFKNITGIQQRRYATENQVSSDIATIAATNALESAQIQPNELSGIIYAHNYGDIPLGAHQVDAVPNLASRVKNKLGIDNAQCFAFDVLGGCPGWIQSVIIAEQFIKGNQDMNILVIGAETLSRVTDPHDRDSMIYADGSGAVVMSFDKKSDAGIKSSANLNFAMDELNYLTFGKSYNQEFDQDLKFIKMSGRKVYEFALKHVPLAMKNCLDKSGYDIKDVAKILIHQANEKMDEAILKRFYNLYDIPEADIPEGVMPMSIKMLGNSSVATVPTLLDLIIRGEMNNQEFKKGDIIILASVGAGMNISALTYKF